MQNLVGTASPIGADLPQRRAVAVLGAGAVGGLLGALIARAGHDVTFVCRDSSAPALARAGVRVTSAHLGDFDVDVAAEATLSRPVDACLIAVKEPALAEALERVPPTWSGMP